MTEKKLIAKTVKENMNKVIARSRYELGDYVDPGVKCTAEEGMTKQGFKDDCDLNILLKRQEQGANVLAGLIKENPMYGDFTDVPTFDKALNIVALAQEQFDALDAKIRARFGNDPAKFLAFANDGRNISEMISMGLATEVKDPKATEGAASSASAPEASK